MQGKRWCFTLNNFSEEEKSSLESLFNSDACVYGIFGIESGDSGTPHLQGFVIFSTNQRFNAVKQLIGDRAHLELARGTSVQARDYCKKDGVFTEGGVFPASAGKRSDLDAYFEWSDAFCRDNGRSPDTPEVAKAHPKIAVKFPRATKISRLRFEQVSTIVGDPRPWQSSLEDALEEEPDDRSIKFVVDPVGGEGKSWFKCYYFSKYPEKTQLLGMGKRDDIAYSIDTAKSVFLFDIPRGQMQYFNLSILESIKDRMIFSPKYSSTMKMLRSVPHVVVFCNEQPDLNALTSDRFDILDTF